MPTIDGDRLLKDQRALADFGRWKTGVHRPTLSPQDMESRKWLASRMTEAGLDAEIDGIANVIGRSKVSGPHLLIGSHTDTQPYAGWLDGAMGVIYGLEIARAFGADGTCRQFGIDVASWADEEGHFGNLLGSRSFCDSLPQTEVDACRHRDEGTPLRTALAAVGLADKPRSKLEPGHYVGYLEAHIEQGPKLEASGLRIGIVTGIVGHCNFNIMFEGEQNHAGTTPMALRKDAGVALIKLAAAILKRFPEVAGPESVWTIGKITLDPGFKSIIPGRADMLFQFRDVDANVLKGMRRALDELVQEANAGPCKATLVLGPQTAPATMAPRFQDALERAAERHAPGKHIRMPSGAGHDAQILAARLPSAMMFVPSIGGISHHHSENTKDEDLVLGCQVLATAAELILRGA
jgi:N-carbamoyl-L-amino-acid hydrolase